MRSSEAGKVITLPALSEEINTMSNQSESINDYNRNKIKTERAAEMPEVVNVKFEDGTIMLANVAMRSSDYPVLWVIWHGSHVNLGTVSRDTLKRVAAENGHVSL